MSRETDSERERDAKGRQNFIIRRYWQIVNMYPRVTDRRLAERIERFTMNATPDELFKMQSAVIGAGAAHMVADPRWNEILDKMDGESVGLAIGDEYQTTVSLEDREFRVEMGISDRNIPVLSVASRKDYVDALLRRKDIVRMLATRKLRATRKLTLVKWGLSFYDLLKDDSLFEELLSHQAGAESSIAKTLESMDF